VACLLTCVDVCVGVHGCAVESQETGLVISSAQDAGSWNNLQVQCVGYLFVLAHTRPPSLPPFSVDVCGAAPLQSHVLLLDVKLWWRRLLVSYLGGGQGLYMTL
jgi:hypothetical protein